MLAVRSLFFAPGARGDPAAVGGGRRPRRRPPGAVARPPSEPSHRGRPGRARRAAAPRSRPWAAAVSLPPQCDAPSSHGATPGRPGDPGGARRGATGRALLGATLVLAGCAAVERGAAVRADLADLALERDDTIVTESARTVDFNGQAVVPRWVHLERSRGGRELRADRGVANLVLGLRPDFTVRVQASHVTKRLERPALPALEADGVGDLSITAKRRLYQRTAPAATTEASLLFGIESPTGADDRRDGGLRLPRPLQPGRGAAGASLGAAFTRVRDRWLLNADLLASAWLEDEGYRFGEELRVDVGGHYRLSPAVYTSYRQRTLNAVLELNGRFVAEDEQDGATVPDTGAARVFLTPGLQWIGGPEWLVEAALLLSVLSEARGEGLEDDFTSILGLRVRF